MVRYQLNGHEFEQTQGDGEGQGSLACYSPWGCKESDTTQQVNNNVSIGVRVLSFQLVFLFFLDMYPGMELLDYTVVFI